MEPSLAGRGRNWEPRVGRAGAGVGEPASLVLRGGSVGSTRTLSWVQTPVTGGSMRSLWTSRILGGSVSMLGARGLRGGGAWALALTRIGSAGVSTNPENIIK